MIKSKHQEIDIEKDRDKYIGGSDLPHILRNAKKKILWNNRWVC